MRILKVSISTYNEIAGLLEQEGVKINASGSLELQKDVKLVSPVDFRLATIRRDVANVAAQVCKDSGEFIEFTSKLFDFVLNGKKEEEEKYDNYTFMYLYFFHFNSLSLNFKLQICFL
jgi:hypothetical protein